MRIARAPRLSVVLLLCASAALAAEDKGKDAKDAGNLHATNISPVAAPIVLDGRLINYVFLTLRLDLAPNVDVARVRDKEPYFRDALVRLAHRRPFVKPGDYTHVDEAAVKSGMMAEAARIMGPHVVTGVDILTAQPQRLTGLPRPEAAPQARAPIP